METGNFNIMIEYAIKILNFKIFNIGKISISLLVSIGIILPVVASWFAGKIIVKILKSRAAKIWELLGKSGKIIEIILRIFLLVSGLSLGFKIVAIDISIFYLFNSILFHPFITLGSSPVSLMSIILLLFIVSSSVFIASYFRNFLQKDIYPKTNLDVGIRSIIDTFAKYFIIATGVVIGLQINGIDMSTFATLGAGLMVGLGFGLQNIANNFVSGIIILVERPIKIGDFVEVDNIFGIVHSISSRSTTIVTRDNVSMLVPNSKFVSENVVNWSHNDIKVRLRIPIGISYDSDPEIARKVLLNIALSTDYVLEEPEPKVLLNEFADSSINMSLEIWIEQIRRRYDIISSINFNIYKEFKNNNVKIPFPQMDLHLPDDIKKV